MVTIRVLSCKLLLMASILFFSTLLNATDQIPEFFIYKENRFYYNGGGFGENYPLYSLAHFGEYSSKLNLNASGELSTGCMNTACYRGYQGTWKVENNTLFLVSLEDGCYSLEEDIIDIKAVFGSKYTVGGVRAFWLTDTIHLTDQAINSSTIGVHDFSYLTLVVENGYLVKVIEKGAFFRPPLEYMEDKYSLASNQLPEMIQYKEQQFYAKGDWNPLYGILVDERYISRMDTDEYGGVELSSCYSSGCNRSYQGFWHISNDTLYLQEVQDYCTEEPIFDLENIFVEEQITTKGVRAFWLTQRLIVSSKEINAFELKNNSDPPTYLKLNIVKGVIVNKEFETD